MLILVLLLDGCATEQARPRPAGPEPAPPERHQGNEVTVDASDAAGDMVDEDEVPVATPPYVDVLSLHAGLSGDSLMVRLVIAGPVPAVHSTFEEITYLVMIDTDGPEVYEYWLMAENRASGEFAAVLTDWGVNSQFDTDSGDFPGDHVVEADTISWRLPLTALGDPSSLRLMAWTQQYIDGAVTAQDYLPDSAADLSAAAEDWIVVSP